MRTALISDVHGNAIALDAVVADLERWEPDQVVYLGDAVQGGAQPAESLRRIVALGCLCARGNTDEWIANGAPRGAPGENISERTAAVGEWSVAQLGDADRRTLASWPVTVTLDLGFGHTLLGFHGSPRSFHDVILPETDEEEVDAMFGDGPATILAGGHTHLQQLRRRRHRTFLNPGSIGFAYDRFQELESFAPDAWAEYAVVVTSDRDPHPRISFARAPFSVAAIVDAYLSSGMPDAERSAAPYRRLLDAR